MHALTVFPNVHRAELLRPIYESGIRLLGAPGSCVALALRRKKKYHTVVSPEARLP